MIKNSSNLVIYSPIKRNKPQLATKSLIVNDKGKRDKISHFKNGYLGYISVQQFKTFDDFSKLLTALESNPHAFILRGSVREGVDLAKPYPRRKVLEKYEAKGQASSVAFFEANESWIGFDIDKMPLSKLGITSPITELDISASIQLLIDTYAPELTKVSCHYQLSSSCGWMDSNSLSCHLFFILKNPLSNHQAKQFAQAVNARAGFQLFDTALYQAVQPHFTAAPIIVAPAIDPIAGKRSGVIHHSNEYLSFDIDKLLLPQKTASKAKPKPRKSKIFVEPKPKSPRTQPLYKPTIRNISTIDGWIKHFETIENLHNEFRTFSNWIYAGKFWGLTKADEKKVFNALRESPRIKKEPTRLALFISSGEYKNLMISARDRQLCKRIEQYRSGFLQPDLTESKQWVNFDWDKDILPLMKGKKFLLLDAPMATGKTTWAIKNFFGEAKNYDSSNDTSVVITMLRFLAKQWAKNGRLDDYELIKKLSVKEKQNEGVFNLSVCLNSIINKGISDFLPSNPILFFDECDAMFRALFSGTIDKNDRPLIFDQLKKLIDDSKFVVLMQHNITPLTLKFLEYFGYSKNDCVVIKNTYQRYAELPVHFHQSDKGLIEKLHQAIDKNERVMVATNSKEQADKIMSGIKEAFPKLRGDLSLSLTSDNSKKKKQMDFLIDPNIESEKYFVVVFSPVMSTGISIENEKFTRTFGFFNSMAGNAPSDCAQMLFRNRAVKQIDYYVDPRQGSLPTDPKAYIAQALAAFDWANHLEFIEIIDLETGNFKINSKGINLLRLHAETVARQAQEKRDFIGNLYAELSEGMGCNVQLIETNTQTFEYGACVKKQSAETVKVERKATILQSEKITRSQFEIFDDENDQTTLPLRRRFGFEDVMKVEIENCPAFKPVDHDDSSIVDQFADYEKANPDIAQSLNDYQNGRIKKKHLFISEAATPAAQAKLYAKHIADNTPEPELKMATYKAFWIRWHLFQLLLPLVGLKAVGWQLQPTAGFEFVYADILANKSLMTFCSKHALALQSCGVTRFRGKNPTADTIGKWLGDMGLSPKLQHKGDKGQQVRVLLWGNRLDTPTTRLLYKYNSIKDALLLIGATVSDDQVEQIDKASNESETDDFNYLNDPNYKIYTWTDYK